MGAGHYPINQWKGYLLVITAAAMWGTNGVAAKYLFNQGLSPSMLVQMRSASSFIILFGTLALFKRELIRLSKKDLPFLITFAIVGMGMVNFMYFYTVSKTNVVTAVLLQYSGIVFIAIFAVSFQGERLTWIKVISLVSAFSGCFSPGLKSYLVPGLWTPSTFPDRRPDAVPGGHHRRAVQVSCRQLGHAGRPHQQRHYV